MFLFFLLNKTSKNFNSWKRRFICLYFVSTSLQAAFFVYIYIYIYIFGFLQKSANVYLLDIPPAPVFLRDPGIVQTVESCIKSSFSTVEIIDQVLIPVCCGKAGR